ncbi:hypothetical protein CW304_21905 [Bacillus sp. UFRGS-B20]|nr:hypothetical protein CW304_21905 [Bacillus sp. UFRGS-B20]
MLPIVWPVYYNPCKSRKEGRHKTCDNRVKTYTASKPHACNSRKSRQNSPASIASFPRFHNNVAMSPPVVLAV